MGSNGDQPQRSPDAANAVPDAANLGPVRPPLVYLGSILLGLLLQFAWPLPLVRHPVGALIGAMHNLAIVEVKSPAQQKECQGVGKTSLSFWRSKGKTPSAIGR